MGPPLRDHMRKKKLLSSIYFSIWKIIQRLVQKVRLSILMSKAFVKSEYIGTTAGNNDCFVVHLDKRDLYSPTFCNCYHLMLWREKQGQRFPPCMRKGAPHILPREDKSRLSTTLLYLPWRQTFSSHWVHV